jgi:signal peptide peptidase SppA
MKDYARIATKIAEAIWLITPEGLDVVLGIAHKRLNGNEFDPEDFAGVKLRDGIDGAGSEFGYRVTKGVGILPIMGPIFGKSNMMTQLSGATSLEMTREDFRTMMNDDSIQSILLEIDSPGGTSDLVQEFGDEIYAANDVKPIYAIADTNAGSAAFWLMSQAGAGIYATPSGAVGSIGAYTVHEDQSGADAQHGHKFSYISAGQHKTEGNPHEPLSHEARAYRQEVIDEIYGDFVQAVARGRNIDAGAVESFYGNGRMMTAKKALDNGVIDGVVPKEALVNQLANHHSKPQVVNANFQVQALSGGNTVAGVFHNLKVPALLVDGVAYSYFVRDFDDIGILLESKEWEHSQSGAGSPPPPRIGPGSEDGSDSKDITSGSRRSPLPLPLGSPGAPSPNPVKPNSNVYEPPTVRNIGVVPDNTEGSENHVNEELLAQLCASLGLTVDSDDDAVLTAAIAAAIEQNALRSAVTATSEETRLSEEFPQFWGEHQAMLTRDRKNSADAFVQSVQQFKRPEGDKLIPTKVGLSALAMETLTQSHIKFAMGQGGLADFESAIHVIADGGIVDYGEHGSSQVSDVIEIDTNTAAGLSNARKLFATKVDEMQKENPDKSYGEALTLAAEKYPDLAAAYRQAAVVR